MTAEAVRTRNPSVSVENSSPINHPQTAEEARQRIEEELNRRNPFGQFTDPPIYSSIPADCFSKRELEEEGRLPEGVISVSWTGKQGGVRGEKPTGILTLTLEEEGQNGLPRTREVFFIKGNRYKFTVNEVTPPPPNNLC